jgi:hypothetical protein|tara:strand:- start:246 stop:524 length:279 start_codon:yes stop_codon:yes gene_type:complete
MTAYIKLATREFPLHQGDIRLEHPEIGEEFICPDTYAPVEWTEPPEYDPITMRRGYDAPIKVANKWLASWFVRAATPEEIEQGVKARKENNL